MSSLHVAIIMDGNGRWATARGLPRTAGHRAGVGALRRVVEEAASTPGVSTLSVFAFSSDNWRRPAEEVETLMGLFGHFLRSERGRCRRQGVRMAIVGRRDRLAPVLRDDIAAAEDFTRPGTRLTLRIAVDYSARDSILRAFRATDARHPDPDTFGRLLSRLDGGPPVPPVDLLIRTGGEQRLSDFLLWECAYAELHFTRVMWPDFRPDDLAAALTAFHRRERRFGGLPGSRHSMQAEAI
jgi:undecaprenyl diphosphate synthase